MLHTDTIVPDKASRVGHVVGPTEDWADGSDIWVIAHQGAEPLHIVGCDANIVGEEKHELRTTPQGDLDAGIHASNVAAIGS
jgi:hypothetical protein